MCDDCGRVCCVCTREPSPPDMSWIVDDDFTVLRVHEFDTKHAAVQTKYGKMPGMPIIKRMNKKTFKTRLLAEKHARDLAEALVETCRAELAAAKKLCKVTRPWEKK